jgi:hypothetical protein
MVTLTRDQRDVLFGAIEMALRPCPSDIVGLDDLSRLFERYPAKFELARQRAARWVPDRL